MFTKIRKVLKKLTKFSIYSFGITSFALISYHKYNLVYNKEFCLKYIKDIIDSNYFKNSPYLKDLFIRILLYCQLFPKLKLKNSVNLPKTNFIGKEFTLPFGISCDYDISSNVIFF